MKKFEKHEEYLEAIKEGKSVLLFSADWCPDCRVIEPFLPELEEKYSELDFYYVDRDDHIDLCQEMDVFGIPSFVAFQDGEESGRFVSKLSKSQEEIEEFLTTVK
ncbi:thioredoxin family protein [Guptibacillus hwajinpoensis]|uniref:Thiol-disulfide isomerase/thioredoxin n=2 Tax=Guptibacillus hwajinpoensis TaxID=208199 RepID=A0ABU0JVX8_9BACL|nr:MULTISPECIES: thioredoxin family protein [Alkalihalobacillus]KMM37354.1 thioredoxin [Alkalihalobacillus macyae]MDP4550968.1 thioredoxin family protein [Alkalihalobacillus macyae]MDQ0481250.1 thiol-disulfide isomerase/thioredoxin [Alkalihalobacillus hemicentroti]